MVFGTEMMGSFSLFHWIILAAVIVLIFGAGRIPTVMGDFAKGIKAFKKGMRDDDDDAPGTPSQKIPPASEDHKVG